MRSLGSSGTAPSHPSWHRHVRTMKVSPANKPWHGTKRNVAPRRRASRTHPAAQAAALE